MIWFSVVLLFLCGCASSKHVAKEDLKPKTMMDVYSSASGQSQKDVAQFIKNNLKEQKTFGYIKPYIPVVNEPVVRKVWIPDHKAEDNSDVLVAGHWVYLMIQPSSWFIEGKTVNTKFPIIVPVSPQNQSSQNKEKDQKSYGTFDITNRENI